VVPLTTGSTLVLGSGITVRGTQSGDVGENALGLVNQGTILANTSGQTIFVRSNTWSNAGTLRATAGGHISAPAPLSNTGVIEADAGTVTLTGNWTNAGTISARNGGVITINGNVVNDGQSIAGAGGRLSVAGNFTQTTTGQLDVELGGVTTSNFGRLQVSAAVNLAGTLNVVLVGGFVPASGNTFEVITFGSRIGDFDVKNGLDQAGVMFNAVFDSNSLDLVVI
jgi:hypothetical protein